MTGKPVTGVIGLGIMGGAMAEALLARGPAVRMKEGAWTNFASGSRRAFRKVEPVLKVFSPRVPNCGAYGNGTKLKFAANHHVAIFNVATAESITFGRKMGIAPRQMLELFGRSPILGTGVYRLRGSMMAARRYRPATMKIEVWQKDMQVIGDMAKALDCPTRSSPRACRSTAPRWRRNSRDPTPHRCARCWV